MAETTETLDAACVETQTRQVSWSAEGWAEYDDAGTWEIVAPESVACGYAGCEGEEVWDDDPGDDDGDCPACHGRGRISWSLAQDSDPDLGAPMMNYAYPLDPTRQYGPQDAEALAGLPLTLVRDTRQERAYLALTGGGMDLSWEIAAGYVALGHLPPAWIRLPAMCGRGVSEDDRALAAACVESCRVVQRWLEGRIEDVGRALQFGRQYEAERAAERA